jgi:hypothetical protein
LRGGAYAVRAARTDDFWNPERAVVQVVFDRSPRTTVAPGGQAGVELPGATFVTCQVVLTHSGNTWLVREVLSNVQLV